MKHLFLFLLGVGSLVSCTKNSTETKVEEKSHPTESLSLEQWLFNNNYDKNHNSKIDPTEVNSIKELNISGQKLKDLKVLNLFTSLEKKIQKFFRYVLVMNPIHHYNTHAQIKLDYLFHLS